MSIQPTGPLDANVLIVGEFPNEGDLSRGEPFIGGVGFEFTKMLQEAGLRRDDCYLTYVMLDRVYGQSVSSLIAEKKKDITPQHVLYRGKYVMPHVVDAVERLRKEIERVRPNVVCTSGNLPLWALTGEWSSFSWRSSVMESTLVPGVKVIPTLPFGLINSQWSQRPIIVHDLKRVSRQSYIPEIISRNKEFLIPTDNSDSEFYRVFNKLRWLQDKNIKIGADIETRAGHIASIAFAWSPDEALCVPLMASNKQKGFWSEHQETVLVHRMLDVMRNNTIIGQNWNYDAQYIFRHWHFLCPRVHDTMIQQHSCFSNLPKNLAFLSSMYCEDHLYWKDDRTGWENDPDGEGERQYWTYNCTDAARTLAIHNVLSSVANNLGLASVDEFQQQLRQRVLKTMIRGVKVDHAKRAQFGLSIMDEVSKRDHWLREATGQDLNIKSPKQMADFFFRQMGQREIKNRKTGGITTNDEALQKISSREPILLPVTRTISQLRSLGVFHSTFVQAPLDIDGRMRCDYNVAGTETYRFASRQNAFGTGMNLQNVPKGGDLDGLELPNIREMFIPDAGHTMADIDLDSADLRIVTWESDCKWMKEQFRLGNKPYVEIMKEYYRDPTKNKHSPEYKIFKSLCHGTNYLGTADGIAPRIGLLVHETERIQKWYLEGVCPEIKKWQDDIKKQVSGRRYVENAYGYRNYFFDRIEGTIFNQAVAWVPQSSVACLINKIWSALEDALEEEGLQILMQVHDSLVMQFPTRIKQQMMEKMLKVANDVAIPYNDLLFIPVGAVTSEQSWGACG